MYMYMYMIHRGRHTRTICDDGTGFMFHTELLGCELHDSGEGSLLRDGDTERDGWTSTCAHHTTSHSLTQHTASHDITWHRTKYGHVHDDRAKQREMCIPTLLTPAHQLMLHTYQRMSAVHVVSCMCHMCTCCASCMYVCVCVCVCV